MAGERTSSRKPSVSRTSCTSFSERPLALRQAWKSQTARRDEMLCGVVSSCFNIYLGSSRRSVVSRCAHTAQHRGLTLMTITTPRHLDKRMYKQIRTTAIMSYAMIMTSYETAWSSWECAWHRPWLRTPLVDTIQNKQSHQASSCFLLLQASLQALFRPWPWFLRCHFAGHLPYLLPNGWRYRLLGPYELFRVSYPCPYQAERRDRGRVIPPKPGAASTIIGREAKGKNHRPTSFFA
jgi:hypothetical protein